MAREIERPNNNFNKTETCVKTQRFHVFTVVLIFHTLEYITVICGLLKIVQREKTIKCVKIRCVSQKKIKEINPNKHCLANRLTQYIGTLGDPASTFIRRHLKSYFLLFFQFQYFIIDGVALIGHIQNLFFKQEP